MQNDFYSAITCFFISVISVLVAPLPAPLSGLISMWFVVRTTPQSFLPRILNSSTHEPPLKTLTKMYKVQGLSNGSLRR